MKFRPHISLEVSDLEASIHFYQTVFGTEPTKQYADYANFRLEEPALHLALVNKPGHRPYQGDQHFGIELFEDAQLADWKHKVVAAGLTPRIEETVTCCYAVADKFWLKDPDGNEWEFWVRHEEADRMHGADQEVGCGTEGVCCAPATTPEPVAVKSSCCS
jgi:catechol 2,3-dioxygenase-like lactoylglutathione lyase family enzyme